MKASTTCKKQEIVEVMQETMHIKHGDHSICSVAYMQIARIVADVCGHNIEYLWKSQKPIVTHSPSQYNMMDLIGCIPPQ
jgi:hypothetical protein